MKTISTFVIAFFIFGSILIGLPDRGSAGFDMLPVEMGCAQIFSDEDGYRCCEFEPGLACALALGEEVVGEFEDSTCNELTGLCSGFQPEKDVTRNVPAISQWGLIAAAGVLGVIGFMVIRRRKASA
jgi:hypothetical protein